MHHSLGQNRFSLDVPTADAKNEVLTWYTRWLESLSDQNIEASLCSEESRSSRFNKKLAAVMLDDLAVQSEAYLTLLEACLGVDGCQLPLASSTSLTVHWSPVPTTTLARHLFSSTRIS